MLNELQYFVIQTLVFSTLVLNLTSCDLINQENSKQLINETLSGNRGRSINDDTNEVIPFNGDESLSSQSSVAISTTTTTPEPSGSITSTLLKLDESTITRLRNMFHASHRMATDQAREMGMMKSIKELTKHMKKAAKGKDKDKDGDHGGYGGDWGSQYNRFPPGGPPPTGYPPPPPPYPMPESNRPGYPGPYGYDEYNYFGRNPADSYAQEDKKRKKDKVHKIDLRLPGLDHPFGSFSMKDKDKDKDKQNNGGGGGAMNQYMPLPPLNQGPRQPPPPPPSYQAQPYPPQPYPSQPYPPQPYPSQPYPPRWSPPYPSPDQPVMAPPRNDDPSFNATKGTHVQPMNTQQQVEINPPYYPPTTLIDSQKVDSKRSNNQSEPLAGMPDIQSIHSDARQSSLLSNLHFPGTNPLGLGGGLGNPLGLGGVNNPLGLGSISNPLGLGGVSNPLAMNSLFQAPKIPTMPTLPALPTFSLSTPKPTLRAKSSIIGNNGGPMSLTNDNVVVVNVLSNNW